AARIVGSAALGTPFSRRLFRADLTGVELDDGSTRSGRYTSLLASTVPSPAVGLRAMPRAGEGDAFHLVATDKSPTRVFFEAGRAARRAGKSPPSPEKAIETSAAMIPKPKG